MLEQPATGKFRSGASRVGLDVVDAVHHAVDVEEEQSHA
jgi:hypothetical protein